MLALQINEKVRWFCAQKTYGFGKLQNLTGALKTLTRRTGAQRKESRPTSETKAAPTPGKKTLQTTLNHYATSLNPKDPKLKKTRNPQPKTQNTLKSKRFYKLRPAAQPAEPPEDISLTIRVEGLGFRV